MQQNSKRKGTTGTVQPRTQTSCAGLTRLTLDEAEQLAEAVLLDIMDDSCAVARALLLCHLLVYTREMSERENIMTRVEKVFAQFLPSYTDTLHADMADALDAIRSTGKGGAN